MHYIVALVLFLPIIFCGTTQTSANLVADAMTVTITSPVDYQIFQRDATNLADIVIEGTYTGSPTAIEASFNGGDYETIDASPAGGVFSGTLGLQSPGQGTLTVRFVDTPATLDTVDFVSIGDVYLVAGQSNAAGHGDNNQSYSHDTLTAVMYKRGTSAWAELADPAGDEGGSPWMHLATLHMASQGVPVGFITTGVDGSGLNSDGDWEQGGGQYNDALSQVTNSGVNTVKAILWHQGEAEINAALSQASYQTALSQMLDDMQADNAALVDAPLVAAQIGFKTTSGSTRTEIDPIRLAIANRWDNDDDILAGPVLYDIDLSDGDGVHFGSGSDSELTTLAERWWRMLSYHFYDGAQGRAPKFAGASRSGTQITVTFSSGFGALTGQTDTTGWRVTDNGAEVSIASAAADGSNKVVLTLSSLPVGIVLVSYGSGNDGAGSTLKDSGTYPLPPEPFTDQTTTGIVDPGDSQSALYDPAFDFYVDIEDASGNKLGSGPLRSVEAWEYTARMDRAGTFRLQMAANDPQAAHVTSRRVVRAYALLNSTYREVGAGIIDEIDVTPRSDGTVILQVGGLDLIRELAYRNVRALEVGTTSGTTHATALTTIGNLAPAGWSLTPADEPANNYIYARYDGESVLGALVYLADRTQTHFYRGSGRELVFASEFETSSIRAIEANGDLGAQTCAIVGLQKSKNTYDYLSRIYATGSGTGAARLTMAATTRAAPTGYTLNKVLNYIENDAATVTEGYKDHPDVEFKEITPIANTKADVIAASNMLFDAALHELTRRSTIAEQDTYDLTVAGCSQLLRPLQTMRVVYHDPDQGVEIDDELYILEATWRVDRSGAHTTGLVVSTDDRWPDNDASAAAERAAQGRVYQAHPQMGPNEWWENGVLYIGYDQATHIAEFPFVLGDAIVTLQQVLFRFKVAQVQSFTSIAVGSADVSVAVDVDVDVDVSGTIDTTHVHDLPDHDHVTNVVNDTTPDRGLHFNIPGSFGLLAYDGADAGTIELHTTFQEGGETSESGGDATLALSGSGTGTGSGSGTVDLSNAIQLGYGVYQAPASRTYAIDDLEYAVNGGAWADLANGIATSDGYFQINITEEVQDPDAFTPLHENNLIEIRRKGGAGSIALAGSHGQTTYTLIDTTPVEHGLSVGEIVIIEGTTFHDGQWSVIEVQNEFSFKVNQTGDANSEGAVGTVDIAKSAMIYAKLGVRTTIQAVALI